MSRTVHCIKLDKQAQGLAAPPMPGEKGLWLYDNVSQQAWELWQQHQTRLINEKHLKLLDPEARRYLNEQMDRFFKNESIDQAEGYVPNSP